MRVVSFGIFARRTIGLANAPAMSTVTGDLLERTEEKV
ncbi:hypothetical protein ABID08_005821 [Rhizobium binae]|uniref:Uncharacterized protein n=1 Tax=Rhizobium binae TaxID=1138190 RepID=A0ABV2MPQ9_9HYPH